MKKAINKLIIMFIYGFIIFFVWRCFFQNTSPIDFCTLKTSFRLYFVGFSFCCLIITTIISLVSLFFSFKQGKLSKIILDLFNFFIKSPLTQIANSLLLFNITKDYLNFFYQIFCNNIAQDFFKNSFLLIYFILPRIFFCICYFTDIFYIKQINLTIKFIFIFSYPLLATIVIYYLNFYVTQLILNLEKNFVFYKQLSCGKHYIKQKNKGTLDHLNKFEGYWLFLNKLENFQELLHSIFMRILNIICNFFLIYVLYHYILLLISL